MKQRIAPSVGDPMAPDPVPAIPIPARTTASSGPPDDERRGLPWGWIAATVLLAPVVASHVLVVALRWVPPPTSAFMLQSPVQPVEYRWVPDERIAEVARKAVVASEDQKFWDHGGFDFEAIEKALEHNQKSRRVRGASTISQQVAKNLFLWQGRSWVRKGLEVYATVLIEWTWGKERILEVYLNIAEFGPGVFGVEAASQKFFGKPAARLTPDEAARLAAVLPSPRKWRAANPGPYVQARSEWILAQMGYRRPVPEPEVPTADLPAEDDAGPPAPAARAPEPGDAITAPDGSETNPPVEPVQTETQGEPLPDATPAEASETPAAAETSEPDPTPSADEPGAADAPDGETPPPNSGETEPAAPPQP